MPSIVASAGNLTPGLFLAAWKPSVSPRPSSASPKTHPRGTHIPALSRPLPSTHPAIRPRDGPRELETSGPLSKTSNSMCPPTISMESLPTATQPHIQQGQNASPSFCTRSSNGSSGHRAVPGQTTCDANDPSTTRQHDIPPSLLALNDHRLPADIIHVILSYFVPGGLQVSNDPAYDSDLLNTRGLLKTSYHFKHELLRKIYSQPLRIYLTNGKVCGCQRMSTWTRHRGWDDPKPTSTILIKKLSHLPLHKWPSITVFFAPKSQNAPCIPATYRTYISDRWHSWLSPYEQAPLGWNFAVAADCVIRQSQFLGQALRFHCQPSGRELRNWRTFPPIFGCYNTQSRDIVPKLKLVFEDPADEHREYKHRELPLWEVNMVFDTLVAWRWASCEDAFQQIKFPPSMVMAAWNLGRGRPPVNVEAIYPHDPYTYLAALQECISLWWTRKIKRGNWRDSLLFYLKDCTYYDFAWYLEKLPLDRYSKNRTSFIPVLRIRFSSTVSGAKPGPAPRWTGEFVTTRSATTCRDSPRPAHLHLSLIH